MGIDSSTTPPTVIGVEIFSEEHPSTLKSTVHTVVVLAADGVNYDAARASLLATLKSMPEHAWLLPLLKLRDSVRPGQILTGTVRRE